MCWIARIDVDDDVVTAGDDTIEGLGGDDIDRVSEAAAAAVVVDLSGATANAGDAADDVITNVENLAVPAFGDTLTGSDDANEIDGGAVDDFVIARPDADVLDGDDELTRHYGDDLLDDGDDNNLIRDFDTGKTSQDVMQIDVEGFDSSADSKRRRPYFSGPPLGDAKTRRLRKVAAPKLIKCG